MTKMLKLSSIFATAAGIMLCGGGIWGIYFTYQNVAREKITTTADASMPNTPVKGPLTLKIQADTIRKHMLALTEGKTYAEMPRQIPKTDAEGNTVLDEQGQPVLIPNTLRDTWVTATALSTALNFAIITYVFSALLVLLGMISLWTGILFRKLSNQKTPRL